MQQTQENHSATASAGGFGASSLQAGRDGFVTLPKGLTEGTARSDSQRAETDKRRKAELRNEHRQAAFASKRTAAALLTEADPKGAGRLAACAYAPTGQSPVSLNRVTAADGTERGMMTGLQHCNAVWRCPVCSAKISEVRRKEMNTLLAWARSEGHAVVMLTLTARHNRSTALAAFVDDMKRASAALRQSKGWRALPLVGTVTATEVTHGANGWHPHLHVLMVLDAGQAAALDLVEGLRGEWLRSLEKQGRNGARAAFQVQGGGAAGSYVAKWGAAEELALGQRKLGRNGSRSPWQLLADARDGDKQAAALWVEFALAFKGKQQLVWSKGLKALAEVKEQTDAEAQAAQEGEQVEELRRWDCDGKAWPKARLRLCSLLAAVADEGGTVAALDRAEDGPTDQEIWRRMRAESEVIEQ